MLEVSMFEGVEFARGSKNVPDNVQVVIEADEKMQFYEVGISIVARFGGLRYRPKFCSSMASTDLYR